MPVLGRWGMLLCIFLFNYAKKEGKGKIFFEGINIRIFSIATLFTIFITVITLELKGLVIFLNVLIFTIFLGKFFSSKIGGITGDILGATNELIEILTLSLILVSERYSWRVPFSLL
jgi:adenosylcobinamide-GDP ribazoletransferase